MTPKETLEFAKKNDVKQLDLRFTDLPGVQQHVSYPIGELSESSFEEGFGFDGSSIRGWAAINESDMLLIPDPATAFMDPFYEIKTLVMNCNVIDPITRQSYDRDPRWIARKAELYVKNSGLADTSNKLPGGGLIATVEDVARFAMALQGGVLLQRESFVLMTTRQSARDGRPTGYGLGLFLADRKGVREAWHTGGQQRVSNVMYLQPDRQVAVVLLTNLEGVGSNLVDLARQIADLSSP